MDRGLILGLGLFETILAVDGRPIFADRHLVRLEKSCRRLGWQVPVGEMEGIMSEILARNHLTQGRAKIRLTITAGSGPIMDLALGSSPLRWMAAMPAGDFSQSISANICPWPRNERSPLVGLKSASYAENLIALDHARQMGFEETILLNTAGQLCETATANLFLAKNGVLLTPPLESGCLPGIAREVVLELAARCRIVREERALTLDDLKAADEVFITSSLRGVVTISKICDQPYAAGRMTARLREYWNVELAR